MKYLLILIFITFVAIIVSAFIKKKEKKLPFAKKKYFFTEAEKKFYLILKQVADKNNWVVFSKVRLRDVLYAYGKNKFFDNNRIKQKHVDFLLYDNSGFSPVVAIELDDSSHNLEKRIERDNFVDKVFASVDLPLLRVRAAANYDINVLEQEILESINKK
jgi:cbb3-type cytochrome oxidase subunit 3